MVLFLDFNSYFASVEQQENPHLRGKPVAVVPVMADTSSCIAASYEAKRLGIKTGTSVREAKRLCPGIALVQARHALYVAYHHRAVAAVDTVVPVLRVCSIDEMACELPRRWSAPELARQTAEKLKATLKAELGECMRVSVGIAPNALLAKLAAEMEKPDGLTLLYAHELMQRIGSMHVSVLSGIGPAMQERLLRVGIRTLQELYDAPRSLLRIVWGSVRGEDMYTQLRGIEVAPRNKGRASFSHSHVLPPDMRNEPSALAVLQRLIQKSAMRLRKDGFYARSMQLFVKGQQRNEGHDKRHAWAQELNFVQTQDTAVLLSYCAQAWHVASVAAVKPSAVGVVLGGLVPAAAHTEPLFAELQGLPELGLELELGLEQGLELAKVAQPSRQKRDQLFTAMDHINRRYGKNALFYGCTQAGLHHAPMRIAFSQIPDIETEG